MKKPPVRGRRQAVGPGASTVKVGPRRLPVVMRAVVPGIDLLRWAKTEADQITSILHDTGAVLFRGFDAGSVAGFEAVLQALFGELVVEHERSSPRSHVAGSVYTSTDHPADQEIFVHNEMSYSASWPMRLGFHCLTPAADGGETPLCDTRAVRDRLPAEILERFRARGVQYVRNYSGRFGLPWQTSFGTTDRADVAAYCARHGIAHEWRGDVLRTRRVGPAFVPHPVLGEELWFNHAAFFHVSTLEPELRDALLADFAPEELPTNTFYGDGKPIEDEVVDELRAAYRTATVAFPWRAGDVLVIDNMLVAHGRRPFRGPRNVVVAMASPVVCGAIR